jgi:hypothetical protein
MERKTRSRRATEFLYPTGTDECRVPGVATATKAIQGEAVDRVPDDSVPLFTMPSFTASVLAT